MPAEEDDGFLDDVGFDELEELLSVELISEDGSVAVDSTEETGAELVVTDEVLPTDVMFEDVVAVSPQEQSTTVRQSKKDMLANILLLNKVKCSILPPK